MKSEDKSQLNIKIDPQLLLKLKAKAIKSGKTLTAFVTELLEQGSIQTTSGIDILEQRLLRIEKHLNLHQKMSVPKNNTEVIFSDLGAKEYGELAKQLFEAHAKEKGISIESALAELAEHLHNYPNSQPELVFQILLGNHDLTGLEMSMAYRHGSCAMRSALNDWTNESLEELNEGFCRKNILIKFVGVA